MKVKTKTGAHGERVRFIDTPYGRLYVKRVNTVGVGKSYILSNSQYVTLETMVALNKRFHFRTLQEINETLKTVELGT